MAYREVFLRKTVYERGLAHLLTHQFDMIRNYLLTAVRNLRKHPGYTLNNVASLGIGMACCLLINEAAVERQGFRSPEEALGRRFETWPDGGEIIGVVRNFNFRSLHSPVESLRYE